MKKAIGLAFCAMLAVFFVSDLAVAQGPCSKGKVGVKGEIDKDVGKAMHKQYPFQTEEFWNNEVQSRVINQVKDALPAADVVEWSPAKDALYDYSVYYHVVAQIGPEFVPGQPNVAYGISAEITVMGLRFKILDVEVKISENNGNLDVAINEIISKLNLESSINNFEDKYTVPPRDARLEASVDPDTVSPEEGERKTKIWARVTDCKGRAAFYDSISQGQCVFLPQKTERGKIKAPIADHKPFAPIKDMDCIYTGKNGDITAEYELVKGLEPGLEIIKPVTVGMSNIVSQELKIKIKGIRLEIKPEKKEISLDENTTIHVNLNKIDTEGNKEPLPNREVEIIVDGLKDGSVSPQGNVTTDSNGTATLTYKAGQLDETVTFRAEYQPKGFNEKATGRGEVSVNPPKYETVLTITSSSEKRYRYDYSKGGQVERHSDDEVISAKVTLPLVFDRSLDVPAEGQRWEYYHAESRDLSYFSATSNSERFNHHEHGKESILYVETTKTVHKTPSDAKIDAPFLNDGFILVFDRKTDKALKAIVPLYGISFTWHVEDKFHSRKWPPEQEETKENPHKENDNYYMKAVEDKIQDPTVTLGGTKAYVEELFRKRGLTPPADIPIKEEKTKVSKIYPDFLVKGGDGKTSFSGEGKKTTFTPTPNGSRREEKILRWELKKSKK